MTSRFDLVVLGPGERRMTLGDGDVVFVGRDADCDLVLDEPKASRRHTKLWVDGAAVRASDLGSSNGTYLDGARLPEGAFIRPGQILAIGLTQIALVPSGGAAPAMLASTARMAIESGRAAETPDQGSAPVSAPAEAPLVPIAGTASRFGLERSTTPDRRQPLPLGATIVGRLPTSDWQLDEVGISQRHARLFATETSLSVVDLGSFNGSFVDGERLEADRETTLVPGHSLRFGASSWRVVDLHARPPVLDANPASAPVAAPGYVLEMAASAASSSAALDVPAGEVPPVPPPLTVARGDTVVGRAASSDWQVDLAGISQRHAKLARRADGLFVTDLGSSNGTFVDGTRLEAERETPLRHGQNLRLAATTWRVICTDAPALTPPSAGGPPPSLFPSVGARRISRILAPVVIVAVTIAVIGAAISTSKPAAGPGAVLGSSGSGAEIPTLPVRSPEDIVTEFLRRRDYGAAQVALHASYGQINERLAATCVRHTRLNGALLDALNRELKADRRGTFFGHANAQVVRLESGLVELDLPGDKVLKLPWAEVASREVAMALCERGIHDAHPIDYASFLAFHEHKEQALEFLRAKLADESVVRSEVMRLLAELEWRVEPEALGLAKPVVAETHPDPSNPTPSKPPETVPTAPPDTIKAPTAEQKALEEDLARQRTELIRSQAGEVMSLARLLRYEDAIRSMQRLIGEAADSPALAKQLEGELSVLEREQQLFARLIAQVNAGGVSIARLADLAATAGNNATLSAGDEEFYTIKLPQGQIRERWRYLGVARMLLLFEELPRTAELLMRRGIFAYERGELDAANSALIEAKAKAKSPEIARQVDEYLAFRLGVAVPPEGFVAYNGRLVSPEEKSMRQSGLVRYRDEWVTPEDKQKYEAGWVKYQGEWVPQDDAKLLAQGFLRYEGRWHSRAELNVIRSVWAKAWVVETPRVHVTSNMDIEFVEELLARLDGAYATYKKYWGKEPPTALRFYAFRTFEDYQKFCLDNKFNQALAAAGFALPHVNICVGYNKGNTLDSYLLTMVHEGGHLFQGRVNQAVFPSWYAEASATYHESHRWEDATTKKVLLTGQWNPMRYYSVRVAIRDKHWMPYTDLMASNAIDHINASHFKAMAFYGQAWALYYYLERGAGEATRKKWYAFREKVEGGALNSGAGRGVAATNAASAALFEQEVMPIVELEAKIKAYFESPDRKLDQEEWQKKLAVQSEQLRVYAEEQKQAGGNPLGSERYVPGSGSGSGSPAGAGSGTPTKPPAGAGSNKPQKPPAGSGSERKPAGPANPPGP